MTEVRDPSTPEQTFDLASDPFCVIRGDGTMALANEAWEALLGYSAEELGSLSFQDLLHPEDRERVMPRGYPSHGGSLTLYVDGRVRCADGAYRVVTWTLLPTPDSGALYALGRPATDPESDTALMAQIEKLHAEIDSLGAMRDNLDMCLTMQEAADVIRRFCHEAMDGWPGEVWMINASRNLLERIASWGEGSEDAMGTMEPAHCWAMRGGRPHTYDPRGSGLACQHHRVLPRRSICLPLKGSNEVLGMLTTWGWSEDNAAWHTYLRRVTTITEVLAMGLANLTLRESLRSQSIRDPLTSLFNRRYMEETFDRELARADRHESPVGLIIFDIDHFKQFNDTHGHRAGDTALVHMGALLSRMVRTEDVACRYGGEEFAVIMPGATLETVTQRAEAIREAIREISVIGDGGKVLGSLTASAGVSVFPEHGTTTEALIVAADLALFAAKTAGRDRVGVAPAADRPPDPSQQG